MMKPKKGKKGKDKCGDDDDTEEETSGGTIFHNTGLFDPSSNGHAADESLDVDAVKKFNTVLAYTIHKSTTAAIAGEASRRGLRKCK